MKGGSHGKTRLLPDVEKSMSDSPITVCGTGMGDIDKLKETGVCTYDLQKDVC